MGKHIQQRRKLSQCATDMARQDFVALLGPHGCWAAWARAELNQAVERFLAEHPEHYETCQEYVAEVEKIQGV